MENAKLNKLIGLLETIVESFNEYSSEKRPFSEVNGWNWPSITYDDLARIPESLITSIGKLPNPVVDKELEENVIQSCKNLESLTTKTLPYIFNGNGDRAIPAYLATMDGVRLTLSPLLGWDMIVEQKAMPKQLANRLRSIEAQLTEIVPQKDDLIKQIRLIQNATETAENLPADLQSLKDARAKVTNQHLNKSPLFWRVVHVQPSSSLLKPVFSMNY